MHEKECTNEVLGLADSLAPCIPLNPWVHKWLFPCKDDAFFNFCTASTWRNWHGYPSARQCCSWKKSQEKLLEKFNEFNCLSQITTCWWCNIFTKIPVVTAALRKCPHYWQMDHGPLGEKPLGPLGILGMAVLPRTPPFPFPCIHNADITPKIFFGLFFLWSN